MPARLTIQDIQKIAQERAGKCLSKKYINIKSKLKIECSEGHVWDAIPSDLIYKNSWCPECGGTKKLTLKKIQEIAKERSGKCLSKKYVNSYSKLTWKCLQGHVWESSAKNVLHKGSWCPQCNIYFGEEICRTTFEQLFNNKFVRIRPKWLINNDKNRMELDGYCENLKTAFEYQGKQHYIISRFSKSKSSLKKRITDDMIKSQICKEKNINLFAIKHTDNLIQLPKLIEHKAKKMNLDLKKINFEKKIDFNKIYSHKDHIKTVQELAKKKDGKCLSKKYVNSYSKLIWECLKGHVWEATPNSVQSGTWCPKCSERELLTIELMQEVARKKGGKCLSKKYISNKVKLKWECAKGHVWWAKPINVKVFGNWCLKCYKLKPRKRVFSRN
tara:strand:- start:33 stop:1193 length:1161 start_codon:yes stop_codon:yes gene_type:complete